jgi:uncharacterized protein YktA (UPF0223 family)
MIRKDKMPGVCAAMLIGIAAYSNLMTMDVHAEESQQTNSEVVVQSEYESNSSESDSSDSQDNDNTSEEVADNQNETQKTREEESTTNESTVDETHVSTQSEDEGDKEDEGNIELKNNDDITCDTDTEYNKYKDSILSDKPADVEGVQDENDKDKVTYTYTIVKDGITYTKKVSVITRDEEDSKSDGEVVEAGKSEDTYYDEANYIYVGSDEDGNDVYIIGQTVTTGDKIKYITNTNQYFEISVTETPVEEDNGNETPTETDVNICDKDGNQIYYTVDKETDVKTYYVIKDGQAVEYTGTFYDSEGNEIDITDLDTSNSTETDEYLKSDNTVTDKATEDITTTTTITDSENENWVKCTKEEYDAITDESQKKMVILDVDADITADSENAVYYMTVDCNQYAPGAYEKTDMDDSKVYQQYVGIYAADEDLQSIKQLLGDYGITADTVQIIEAQTSVNAKNLVVVGQQTGTDHTVLYIGEYGEYSYTGGTMRFENISGTTSLFLNLKGFTYELVLSEKYAYLADLSGDELKASLQEIGIRFENSNNTHITIEDSGSDVESVDQIRSEVSDYSDKLMNKTNVNNGDSNSNPNVEGNTLTVYDVSNTGEKNDVVYANVTLEVYYELKGSLNDGVDANTVYTAFQTATGKSYWWLPTQEDKQLFADFVEENGYGSYAVVKATKGNLKGMTSNGLLHIQMKEDQILVINVDTTGNEDVTIDLTQYNIDYYTESVDEDGNKTYTLTNTIASGNGDASEFTQRIIFNFGSNFTGTLNTTGAISGTFIAPNADFTNNENTKGQLISKSFVNSQEWHYTGNSYLKETGYVRDIYVKAELYRNENTTTVTETKTVDCKQLLSLVATVITQPEEKQPVDPVSYKVSWTSQDDEEVVLGETSYADIKITKEKTPTPDPTPIPDPTPTPTPDPIPTPTPTPTEPKTPSDETPDTPSDVTTLELVTIDDEDVALSAVPTGYTIIDEEVPLAAAPKTYDNSFLATLMGMLTAFGSAIAGIFTFKKSRDNK